MDEDGETGGGLSPAAAAMFSDHSGIVPEKLMPIILSPYPTLWSRKLTGAMAVPRYQGPGCCHQEGKKRMTINHGSSFSW